MSTAFDDHPAFDALSDAFQAMDREGIVDALQALREAVRDDEDRQALGDLGSHGLVRLAMLDPVAFPEGTDVNALLAWSATVAQDLLDAGAFVNGSAAQIEEDDWMWPVTVAASHRNWPLIRVLLAHGASPMGTCNYDDGDDVDRLVSVVGMMLSEPTAAVALDLLGTLIDPARLLRQHSPNDMSSRLGVERIARLDSWSVTDRIRVAQRLVQMAPSLAAGDLALVRHATDGHDGAVEVLLGLGLPVGFTTVKELRWVPPEESFGERPMLTARNGLMHRGYTALHAAVLHRRAGVVQVLVKHGADVNAATDHGVTPLHLAAMNGDHRTTMALLLAHGADVGRPDAYGSSPASWARQSGQPETAQRLVWADQQVLRDAIDTPATITGARRPRL